MIARERRVAGHPDDPPIPALSRQHPVQINGLMRPVEGAETQMHDAHAMRGRIVRGPRYSRRETCEPGGVKSGYH